MEFGGWGIRLRLANVGIGCLWVSVCRDRSDRILDSDISLAWGNVCMFTFVGVGVGEHVCMYIQCITRMSE